MKTHTQTSHHIHILKGKGKAIQSHTGNVFFRTLVKQYEDKYTNSQCRKEKNACCDETYSAIKNQNPPGRFLQQDPISRVWTDITKYDAFMKIRQALREGSSTTKNIHNKSDDNHSLSSASVDTDSSFEGFFTWISGSDIWCDAITI